MIRTAAFLATALIALSGCVSIFPDSGDLAPRLTLDAGEPPATPPAAKYNATLAIDDPNAAAAYNTFLVAIARSPLEFQYLADAEWADRVPVLMRRFFERRFDNRRLFVAVGDRTDIPMSDYTVQTDIRAFNLDATTSDEVARASIGARLVDNRGRVVATKVFTHTAAPNGSGRSARAVALNQAATDVADEMLDWIDGEVEQVEAAKAE